MDAGGYNDMALFCFCLHISRETTVSMVNKQKRLHLEKEVGISNESSRLSKESNNYFWVN